MLASPIFRRLPGFLGPLGTLAVMAAYVTVGVIWRRAQLGLGEMAYDFYGLFYPNAVYARESLAAGGHGLLWTPYQACGLPFLANSQVALFYPGHLLFLLLPREPALLASVLLHLVIAGAGAFLLCRAIGLGTPAALCGALAFELGPYTVQFAGWGPIHFATYAWMSVAAWRAERLVRTNSTVDAVTLAVVLMLQLLAGFIQTSYFTFQLVALRVVWAAATREQERPWALLGRGALALGLGVGLAGILVLPAFEMVRESIRSRPLVAREIGPGFSWTLLVETVRSQVAIPFYVLVSLLALLSLILARRLGARSAPVFWGLVLVGCIVLSMGPGSGVWELYAQLPLAASFRGAGRTLWVAHLAAAVLAAAGAEAAARPLGRAALLLPLAMIANALVLGPVPYFSYRAGDVFDRHADVFAYVKARLTPQDRVHLIGEPRDVALGPKSASRFHVPAIYDYEAQPPRRYAEYFTYLRTGRPLETLDDWHWILDRQLPETVKRPLLDRTAARYVVVASPVDAVPKVLSTGVRLLTEIGGVRVYENTQALPRARWVPSSAVLPAEGMLDVLANGGYDPRQTVLLEPPAGATTPSPAASGEATITADEPERVVVQVRSSADGFLVVADSFYPGWSATVNGDGREIHRADYAFRAVAVPAGESEVVFTYRPKSVRLGALLSAATGIVILLLLRTA